MAARKDVFVLLTVRSMFDTMLPIGHLLFQNDGSFWHEQSGLNIGDLIGEKSTARPYVWKKSTCA
jgi:hypothetical protein